jgi:hypothetical protein
VTSIQDAETEPAGTLPAAAQLALRLQVLLRSVNREIARRAGDSPTAAFVCECEDRGCAEAVEVPLVIFRALEERSRFLLVRPSHEDPLHERVVRRGAGYLVVERTTG